MTPLDRSRPPQLLRRPKRVTAIVLFLASAVLAGSTLGCSTARLEPARPDQKVANKPNAAFTELSGGVRLQVEAGSWMADERVKYAVTAMKVTLVNSGTTSVDVAYDTFRLTSDAGKSFLPVPPEEIPIRGANRSIGLAADTIVTRTSDSAVNAPNRDETEKDEIRRRLQEQALKSGSIPAGERTVGYVFFERVPASVESITFHGNVSDPKTGSAGPAAKLEFRPRMYQ